MNKQYNGGFEIAGQGFPSNIIWKIFQIIAVISSSVMQQGNM
jgi:hypothetical protein